MKRLLPLLLLAPLAPLASPAAGTPPNFILLMADDQGWEETGYNGHPDVQTPVLDEIAATGLRLDRFYSAHPSCSPTRGSCLTGRHPNRYGTFSPGFSLRPEEITVAHLLRERGYSCAHFGKWHVGTVKEGSPTNPGAMGFDTWLSHDNFFELNPSLSRDGAPPEIHRGESSAILVEEASRFIEAASAEGTPFFVIIWFGSPHEPYSGLAQDLALYDHLPEKYADRPAVRLTSNETGRQVQRPQGEVLRERYAEITAMDRAIGQLRRSLTQHGLRDNTLLWFCSDNGTSGDASLASPLRGRKGQVYEGGIRVPGLVEWPARIPSPRSSDFVSVTSDFLPTLAELVGAALPERPLDGISLVPLIDGTLPSRPSPLAFWSYHTGQIDRAKATPYIDPELQRGTTPLVKLSGNSPTRNFTNFHHPEITETNFNGSRAIIDGRFKLVLHDGRGDSPPRRELFDLVADPAEKDDLSSSSPAQVESMAAALRAWQESVLNSLTGADYLD